MCGSCTACLAVKQPRAGAKPRQACVCVCQGSKTQKEAHGGPWQLAELHCLSFTEQTYHFPNPRCFCGAFKLKDPLMEKEWS